MVQFTLAKIIGSEATIRLRCSKKEGLFLEKSFHLTHIPKFKEIEKHLFRILQKPIPALIEITPLKNTNKVGYRTMYTHKKIFNKQLIQTKELGPIWCHYALLTQAMLLRHLKISTRDCDPSNYAVNQKGEIAYIDYGTRMVPYTDSYLYAINALDYLVKIYLLINNINYDAPISDLSGFMGNFKLIPRFKLKPQKAPWSMPLYEAIHTVTTEKIVSPEYWQSLASLFPSKLKEQHYKRLRPSLRTRILKNACNNKYIPTKKILIAARKMIIHLLPSTVGIGSFRFVSVYQHYLATPNSIHIFGKAAQKKAYLLKPSLAKLCPGCCCLDLGSNLGLFSLLMSQLGAKEVLGIDEDRSHVQIAKKVAKSIKNNRVCFTTDKVQDINAKYDVVLVLAIIHHIYCRTAGFGSFESIFRFLSRLTKKATIVEYVNTNDPMGWRAESNSKLVNEPYTEVNFLKAFNKYFKEVKMIGLVSSKRVLYIGYK